MQTNKEQMQQIINKGNFGHLPEAGIFAKGVNEAVAKHLANGMPTYEQCPALMLAAFDGGDYIELAALAYFRHIG